MTGRDINTAIEMGLRECDLYEVAKDDIISRADLRKFLLGALEYLKGSAQPEYLSGCQLRGPGECQSRGMCQSMACVHRGKVIVKRVCVEAQVDGIVYPKVGT